MLVWRRIAWHKRYTFFSKLLFLNLMLHGLALFTMLFWYRGENFTQTINFDVRDLAVVFLPFEKAVKQSVRAVSGSAAKAETAAEESVKETKALRGAVLVSEAKKEKKQAKQKKLTVAKKEKKKIEKKVVEKKVEPLKVEPPVEEKTVVAQAEVPQAENAAPGAEEVLYLGQEDLGTFELHEMLHDEIERAWRPPAGLACGKFCKVRVLISWQGKAEEIVFEESSRVLAFDTSVRQALLTMKFPKSAYGKELILPFH